MYKRIIISLLVLITTSGCVEVGYKTSMDVNLAFNNPFFPKGNEEPAPEIVGVVPETVKYDYPTLIEVKEKEEIIIEEIIEIKPIFAKFSN